MTLRFSKDMFKVARLIEITLKILPVRKILKVPQFAEKQKNVLKI